MTYMAYLIHEKLGRVYSNFIHAYGYGVGVFDDCDAYSGGVFGY
jgi:hypothetical protein